MAVTQANNSDAKTAAPDVAGGLLPPLVRRWVGGGLALLLASAAYLIAVRGTAIVFDLAQAVSALCF